MQLKRESIHQILENNPDRTKLGSMLLGSQQRRELLKTFLKKIYNPVLTKEQLSEFIQIVYKIRQMEIENSSLPKLKTTQRAIELIPAGNAFFDVYQLLVTDKFIEAQDAELSCLLAGLQSEAIYTFRSIYSYLKTYLDKQLLPAIIATLAIDHKSFSTLILYLQSEKLLRLGETLLDKETLSIITHHRKELPLLDTLLRKLYDSKCLVVQEKLVYDYLTPLKACNNLETLTELLNVISGLTPGIFSKCCKHPKLADLLEVSKIMRSHTDELQPFVKTFPTILELNGSALVTCLKPLVNILHKIPGTAPQLFLDSLDLIKSSAPNSTFLNFEESPDALMEFLSILIKSTILTKDVLALLIAGKINIHVQKAHYLQEHGFLNIQTLEELSAPYIDIAPVLGLCLKVDAEILKQLRFLQTVDKLGNFKDILSLLLRTNKALAIQFIPQLLQIKPKYFPQIAKKCSHLAQNKDLHETSIKQLFYVHIHKVSQPVAESVTLTEKMWNEDISMMHYQLKNKEFLFSKEPVNTHAFGTIHEGFQADNPDNKWQLKLFNASDDAKKFAKNESKYGKEVILINTETTTATLMSMSGVCLKDFKADDLNKIDFPIRLKIFRNFLESLVAFHGVRREVKNIILDNCKLEITDGKVELHLSSMGEAHKIKNLFSQSVYPEYKDKSQPFEDHLILAREMNAVGILCARLFPEYQEVIAQDGGFVCKPKELPVEKLHTKDGMEYCIVSMLVSSMTDECRSNRTTSALAVDFCDRVLAKNEWKQEDLNTIRDATINKQACNYLDIIQDRFVCNQ